jgi:hypothetical protein
VVELSVYSPFGGDPCKDLEDRLSNSLVRYGLNALTRAIELERGLRIAFFRNDTLAPFQAIIAKPADRNVIEIHISTGLKMDGDHRYDFRFILAHELAHLLYRHDECWKYIKLCNGSIEYDVDGNGSWLKPLDSFDALENACNIEADALAKAVLLRYNHVYEREEMNVEEVINLFSRLRGGLETDAQKCALREELDYYEDQLGLKEKAAFHLFRCMKEILRDYSDFNDAMKNLGDPEFLKMVEKIQKRYRQKQRHL